MLGHLLQGRKIKKLKAQAATDQERIAALEEAVNALVEWQNEVIEAQKGNIAITDDPIKGKLDSGNVLG